MMITEIEVMTVAELHAQLQKLIEDGLGDVPVCATDLRARYPLQAYSVLSESGYTDAFLINVRPDAHFKRSEPLPPNWGENRLVEWNSNADAIRQSCGPFANTNPSTSINSEEC
ncbi:hypothetical protein H9T43_002222 [Salmonella enterica]|nr:hypothetical protein [Salmonella enterica]